ncbi:MAG: hypothetical protein GWN14_01175, partial [candidate division Zixibacteria bacterium]|nr:hypothetical protein [candidate division Zixibacteria bacterium]NIX54572.1 hypothetical protein [candidate division Zixibacteria bacterium]
MDHLYELIHSVLIKSTYQVIISDPLDLLKGRPLREGMQIKRWVNTATVYPNTDHVIHHGGYATTLESLWWGIPSIILPSHSEQEGNGRRLEKLNAGKVTLIAEPPYQQVKFSFHTGEFTMLGGYDFSLTNDLLISTIEQILADESTRNSAVKQGERLRT